MKKKIDKEIILILLQAEVYISAISILFYDSVVAFFILQPLAYLFCRYKKRKNEVTKKIEVEKEFRHMLLSVSTNLSAGYSVENSFRESYKDVVMMYGKDSEMAKEIYLIIQKLHNNNSIEEALMEMGQRKGIEDIQEFANVFQISKRRGGDIKSAIANTSNILSDKIDVRRQIQTIMSQKQLEQKLMRYIPFIIMTYVSFTSKDFFDGLYHNFLGILIMTGCLIVYIAAWIISEKILDIEI